ncbi:MAG TPA: molybdenum cofactor guanylyltransferase [Candidatus Angelobacter sp.]|nr:molybdenum cofactor guanylyltransferase [Candidatus Angelobacter sp.]
MPLENVTGFVLAGGKSTRMGHDKAVLTLQGRTLLEHTLATLRHVCREAVILGSRQLYGDYDAVVVEDIFPGCGPLSGIHAALSHTDTEFNLIIAVDTPFLSAEFLSFMAQRAVSSGAVVSTPEIGGYRQPLCSVYSRAFLPLAEAALRGEQDPSSASRGSERTQSEGEASAAKSRDYKTAKSSDYKTGKSRDYKIVPLFPVDGTCVIPEEELRRFAFAPEMFENINTPADMERARRRGAATPDL